MEWIVAWLNGIPDTWLRAFAVSGAVGLALAVWQVVTGWQANRRLKEMDLRQKESERRLEEIQQFLFKKFGKRIEIQGAFKAEKAEMTATVGVRPEKKTTVRLTFRQWLGKLFP